MTPRRVPGYRGLKGREEQHPLSTAARPRRPYSNCRSHQRLREPLLIPLVGHGHGAVHLNISVKPSLTVRPRRFILYNGLEPFQHRKWRSLSGVLYWEGVVIMVKRVSSKNRRKGHVRPRNVKRRVKKDEKATAQMQIVLGRSHPTPAASSGESAESG